MTTTPPVKPPKRKRIKRQTERMLSQVSLLTRMLTNCLNYLELAPDLEYLSENRADRLKYELAQLCRGCDEILRLEPFQTTFTNVNDGDVLELRKALRDAQRVAEKCI